MSYKPIKSINQLKNESQDEQNDFFIHLGGARSSKMITYDPEEARFHINHEIDGSDEVCTEAELVNSNIGLSIEAGNFYKY